MDCIDKQDSDLLSLLLNEANWRGCRDLSRIERRLHCRSTPSLRREIEPHDVFVALQRLYIGHREEARPLSGTPTLPGRINFSNLKTRQLGPLGGLEAHPMVAIDPRRPLDRLDRRKALQQAPNQVAKVGP